MNFRLKSLRPGRYSCLPPIPRGRASTLPAVVLLRSNAQNAPYSPSGSKSARYLSSRSSSDFADNRPIVGTELGQWLGQLKGFRTRPIRA